MSDQQATPSPSSGPLEAEVDETQVVKVAAGPEEAIISGTMLAYRHNWGAMNGVRVLRLNWAEIMPDSLVLASVSEGGMMGDAHFILYNVVPRSGGVDIRVNVAWGSPIALRVDYFAILRAL